MIKEKLPTGKKASRTLLECQHELLSRFNRQGKPKSTSLIFLGNHPDLSPQLMDNRLTNG